MKKSKILWITLLGIGIIVAIAVIITFTTHKPTVTPTKKEPVEESKEIYETDTYSIAFPLSWQDKYSVIAGENEEIGLYNTANMDAGYGGYVAGISVFSVYDQWNEEGFIDSPIYLGSNKDKTKFYVIGGPTDVNFNHNDTDLAAEYKAMTKDIPEIASSFKLLS